MEPLAGLGNVVQQEMVGNISQINIDHPGPLFSPLPGLTLDLSFSSRKRGERYCAVSQLCCKDVCISTLSRALGTS